MGLQDTARFAKHARCGRSAGGIVARRADQMPADELGKEGGLLVRLPKDLRASSVVYSFGVGEDIFV